jgi:hypothetical protein
LLPLEALPLDFLSSFLPPAVLSAFGFFSDFLLPLEALPLDFCPITESLPVDFFSCFLPRRFSFCPSNTGLTLFEICKVLDPLTGGQLAIPFCPEIYV